MTNKFNVGDKVVPIKDLSGFGFPEGEVATIVDVYAHGTVRIRNEKFREATFYASKLQLAKPKPTEEQRITKLEKEVEELKLIVAQIRKPSTVVEEALANDTIEFEGKQYKKVEREAREGDVVVFNYKGKIPNAIQINKPYLVNYVHEGDIAHHDGVTTSVCNFLIYNWGRNENNVDVYELMDGYNPGIAITDETPIKTANQLRAEIIEKAKGFIDENGGGFDFDIVERSVYALYSKPKKKGGWSIKTGDSHCHPSDVFNEHIGKAIALGRALGLDVSEFEQAAQPSHYAVGQIGINQLGTKCPFEIIKIGVGEVFKKNFEPYTTSFGDTTKPLNFSSENYKPLTIINDTNAQYEVNK